MTGDPDSSFEVQAAIRLRLLADPALASIIGARVHDRPPDDCPTPYVQFGPFEVMPYRAQCLNGSELFMPIYSWADGQTASAQVKRINARIRALLDGQRFAVAGHVIQGLFYLRTRLFNDPDGRTRQGVNEFRCFTLPAA